VLGGLQHFEICNVYDIIQVIRLMKTIDWTKIVSKYKGLWVGFKNDNQTVVATGKTPTEVIKKAKQKGYDQPILFRVPTRLVAFVGIIDEVSIR